MKSVIAADVGFHLVVVVDVVVVDVVVPTMYGNNHVVPYFYTYVVANSEDYHYN
jgi:hypothetical protein